MRFSGTAGKYRRKAVATAAGAAALGAAPILAIAHGHRGMGLALIGVQILLLVAAVRFLFEAKRVQSAGSQ